MYNSFQLAAKYLRYWFTASNGKGHGVHSPFVFEFIIKVLHDKSDYECYASIEALRRQLLANETIIEVEDFGAGSRSGATKKRAVQSIAASGLKPRKFAQLLHRVARYYHSQNIVELGTSLGVTTSYLAASPHTGRLCTLEGSRAIADLAAANFASLGYGNIEQVIGNF